MRARLQSIACNWPKHSILYQSIVRALPRLASYSASKLLHFHASGAWLKDWRQRYFSLVGNMLYFSKSENDEPHGQISLETALTVKSASAAIGRENAFVVSTPNASFYCCAPTVEEKDAWIGAIGRAIVRYSHAVAGGALDGRGDDEEAEEFDSIAWDEDAAMLGIKPGIALSESTV